MKKKLQALVPSVIFLGILVFVLLQINKILEPKYVYKNSTWPTTSSYHEFYKMRENTVDVLFFGSSVCVNAFAPQEIYNRYGIRSYNLGSEQQSIFLSYYWLKEALRFQKPRAVVLDTRYLFGIHNENAINTTEGLTRKCLDPMRLSPVKAKAVWELGHFDKKQSRLSYLFTNIRFHSRWAHLSELDFTEEQYTRAPLKGFGPIASYGPKEFKTFTPRDKKILRDKLTPVEKRMFEYLRRMARLCKEEKIALILLSLPGNPMNDAINNTLTKFSAENKIAYYNLCEKDNYARIGAKLPRESVISHENIWGARKMSAWAGNLLATKYKVPCVKDEQWEATKKYYASTIKAAELSHITDFAQYLRTMQDENFSIFISVRDNADGGITPAMQQELKKLGLRTEWKKKFRWSYLAVITPGQKTVEMCANKALEHKGTFRDGRSQYAVVSKGLGCGNTSSIIIDGVNYSKNGRGFNIVVYDHLSMKVIDKVRFDTMLKKFSAIR